MEKEKDAELFEGKYEIAELLGEGGMGVVHAAVNVYSGARVAIKRLSKEVAEGLTDRLLGECRALALLTHPNIVRLLDCGPITRGGVYLAMELVEGDTLRTLIRVAKKAGKPLDLDLVIPIIAQTAEAMEFVHSKGIYHRDLKPENIMVCKGGLVKLLDFGLAKTPSIGPIPGVNPTNPASVLGTVLYMAPEQVRGQAIDARTDIYGLGVVLYETVSSRTPYDKHVDAGTTDRERMGYHLFADPTPIREHVPTCPDRLWEVISRCLAKAPGDRYADMATLAKDLRGLLDEMNAPSPQAEPAVAVHGALDIRETAPPPMGVPVGAVLPFTPAAPPSVDTAVAAQGALDIRETAPPPQPFAAGPALPFVKPPEPRRLGKGHTQPLPSAATLLAQRGATLPVRAEPPISQLALSPPSVPAPSASQAAGPANGHGLAPVMPRPVVIPPEPPSPPSGSAAALAERPAPPSAPGGVVLAERPAPPSTPGVPPATSASPTASPANGPGRDSGDGPARSGPSFTFEPTSPQQLQATPTAAGVAGSEKPKRMRLSPVFALPVAFVLAGLILVAVIKLRDRRDSERLSSAPSASAPSASAPSASAPTASASPTSAPSASAAPADAPVAFTTPSGSSEGPTAQAPGATEVQVATAPPLAGTARGPRTIAGGSAVTQKRPKLPEFIGADPVEPEPVFMVRKKPEPKLHDAKKPEAKKPEAKKPGPIFGVDQ